MGFNKDFLKLISLKINETEKEVNFWIFFVTC
jgi:hypothetical protein